MRIKKISIKIRKGTNFLNYEKNSLSPFIKKKNWKIKKIKLKINIQIKLRNK